MSDDNLESLDNASLRKKCLEFGLPNVPVTDTSRKLLIRKLRAVMTGEPADKKKNRRETIHVTKIPSPVDAAPVEEAPKRPPSRVNRRTIAATSVTSTVDDTTLPVPVKAAPISDRRRSVRSQAEQDASLKITISQKRNAATVVLEEDDENDEDDVILLEAAEKSEREVVIPRTRRSVSLSKTGVVTTSYSQETVAAPPTVNETESESEIDFVKNYANSYEPLTRPLHPPQTQSVSYGLSQRKVPVPELDRISSFRTTAVNRTSIEPEPFIKAPPSTTRYSSLGSGYSANKESITTTSTTRRFTTGGYGGLSTPATKYTNVYDELEDDEDQPEPTPYLSDFARRLERLKAEPLVKGVESPRSAPVKRESQRYQSSIVGRRGTTQKDSVTESLKNFLLALDRKYNLKRNFAIAFGVMLLLFVYIVFIH